ncbi:MAG: hypothetical protein Q4B04_03105, partial [bacterium]|nr:hypothetical protein [bacterium]
LSYIRTSPICKIKDFEWVPENLVAHRLALKTSPICKIKDFEWVPENLVAHRLAIKTPLLI